VFTIVFTGLKINVENPQLHGTLGKSILLSVNYSLEANSKLFDVAWHLHRYSNSTRLSHYDPGSSQVSLFGDYIHRTKYFPNASIFLQNLNFSDEGLYVLTIALGNGKETTGEIRLTVDVPVSGIVITQIPEPVKLYEKVILNCSVEEGTKLKIKWLNGSSAITNDTGHQVLPYGQMTLMLAMETPECGTYICVAENPISRVEENHTFVGEKPMCGDPCQGSNIILLSVAANKLGLLKRG
uniref:Ig-like domain-containing protein n=1 Tax=Latimeria chalumnae TaxID=7897 RepID=H2ZSR7_LATCH